MQNCEMTQTRFNSSRQCQRTKGDFTFEDLYTLLDSTLSYEEIGINLGLTLERIRQLYEEYFSELLPDRPKVRVEKIRLARIKNLSESLPQTGDLAVIIEKAKLMGLEAKRNLTDDNGRVSTRSLIIEGKSCIIRYIRRASQTSKRSKRSYARLSINQSTRDKFSFCIIYVDIEGYPEKVFIIPTKDITTLKRYIYLPPEKLPVYRNIHPKIDYFQYENAWHYLQ